MTYREPLSNKTVAISISESADLEILGLSAAHLHDAAETVARHLLALGARLLYGGDLRPGGFTNALFELVARYKRDVGDDLSPPVTNYLAWPVHARLGADELARWTEELHGVAELVLLSADGKPMSIPARGVAKEEPSAADWARGLSAMRMSMQDAASARILIGGRTDRYMGSMPGIAEEALVALASSKPVYILGGFGGCARDVAALLGLSESVGSRQWPGQEQFAQYTHGGLNNGLSAQENRELSSTPHIEQAVTLLLRGMIRAFGDQ